MRCLLLIQILAFVCVLSRLSFGLNTYDPMRPSESQFSTVYWRADTTDYKDLNYGYALPRTNSVPVAKVAATTELQDGWHAVYVDVDSATLTKASRSALMMNATWFAVGYAEGYATSELIYYSYYNQRIEELMANFSSGARKWVDDHIAHMYRNAFSNPQTANNKFWAQVGKILLQVEGMHAGYTARQSLLAKPKPLTFLDVFMISFIDETADVERSQYLSQGLPVPPEVQERLKTIGEHCSALIKLVSFDVFIAHTTWNSLNGLLRSYKTYKIGPTVLQMSSYPGNVASDDDYYYLNNGLVAQETTNHNHNTSNYGGTVSNSVSEFIRAVASSYLSNGDPTTWATSFCSENSGTYNNQYMLLQMQGFVKASAQTKASMKANSFVVLEQMPGLCMHRDQTQHLNEKGYWASYNRPFYPEIYEGMNWTAMKKISSYYSYDQNYRAKIFAREEGRVLGLADMKRLMRYNDYKNDDLSVVPECPECWPQHTPYLSIAARCDLIPKNGSFGVLDGEISLQNEAALDAKITSLNSWKTSKMMSTIAMGPPFGGPSDLPPFNFKTTLVTPRPRNMGLPDIIKYNYTSSNSLYINAPTAVPDFTKLKGVTEIVIRAQVSASTFVRSRFNEDFRNTLIRKLNYTDPTGETKINFIAAHWYGAGIEAQLTISGPESANWENSLVREGHGRLSAATISGVHFKYASPPVVEEEMSKLWIIGVVVASLMAVIIMVLLLKYIRKYKEMEAEEKIPLS